MFRRHYNLGLMGLWLAVGVCLIAPEVALPERVRQNVRGPGGVMVGALALTFAVYNLVRWWALRSLDRGPAVNPLAARKRAPEDHEPYAPNPELDFLKVPDAEGGPTATGDDVRPGERGA